MLWRGAGLGGEEAAPRASTVPRGPLRPAQSCTGRPLCQPSAWLSLGTPGERRGTMRSPMRPRYGRACAATPGSAPRGPCARPLPAAAWGPEEAAGESRGARCGRREHAGRSAARARRVSSPAAVAAARGGSFVSGGRGGRLRGAAGGAMWSGRSSFTSLVVGVFVVYVVHTCWVMYGIVYTRPCTGDASCIQPYLARRPKLQVSAAAGLGGRGSSACAVHLSPVPLPGVPVSPLRAGGRVHALGVVRLSPVPQPDPGGPVRAGVGVLICHRYHSLVS